MTELKIAKWIHVFKAFNWRYKLEHDNVIHFMINEDFHIKICSNEYLHKLTNAIRERAEYISSDSDSDSDSDSELPLANDYKYDFLLLNLDIYRELLEYPPLLLLGDGEYYRVDGNSLHNIELIPIKFIKEGNEYRWIHIKNTTEKRTECDELGPIIDDFNNKMKKMASKSIKDYIEVMKQYEQKMITYFEQYFEENIINSGAIMIEYNDIIAFKLDSSITPHYFKIHSIEIEIRYLIMKIRSMAANNQLINPKYLKKIRGFIHDLSSIEI